MSWAELVLASASPRRAALLRERGYPFRIAPAVHAEPDLRASGLAPADQAEALGYFKARSASEQLERKRNRLILGADTLVSGGTEVYGKPRDAEDARRILTALSGTTHDVITGVALWSPDDGRRWITHETTRVAMRALSESELAAYLSSRAWEGKAGAYGIQDRGDPFVECIGGSFSNVVGLPVERVAAMLSAWGWPDAV